MFAMILMFVVLGFMLVGLAVVVRMYNRGPVPIQQWEITGHMSDAACHTMATRK